MKTVLFMPGYQEGLGDRDYMSVMRAIEAKGYRVIFVPIEWKRTTITHWTAQLNKIYMQYDPDETILAGFSFGAMTAFVAAAERPPVGLWLFSLSPYFAEDLVSPASDKKWLKYIGSRRVAAFAELRFAVLAQRIHTETKIFIGSYEIDKDRRIEDRAKDANKHISSSELIIIEGAGHDVAHPVYIGAVERAI